MVVREKVFLLLVGSLTLRGMVYRNQSQLESDWS